MTRTGLAIVLALAAVTGGAYRYESHARMREDAIAAFALSEIDRKDGACRRPYETEECKRYPLGCAIPLQGCQERKDAAERAWALKYPRQSARRQAQ